MSFPLYRIPSLLFYTIFGQMDILELAMLTACSKKSRKMVSSFVKISPFAEIDKESKNAVELLSHFLIETPLEEFKKLVTLTIHSDFKLIINIKQPDLLEIRSLIHCYSWNNGMTRSPCFFGSMASEEDRTYWWDPMNGMIRVIESLRKFFGLEITTFECEDYGKVTQWMIGKHLDHLVILWQEGTDLLDLLTCQKTLTITHAGGVRLSHLQALRCLQVFLENSKLSDFEIRGYLDTWLQGSPTVKILKVKSQIQFQWDRILEGLLPKDSFDWMGDLVTIRRADGKEAAISFGPFEFRMLLG
uniref:F-box domain-containing protein n=1 Tax=Caenorhabditis tropicalis TaxID=1561998 RepID=A0A1I7V1E1_9PELO